MKTIWKYEIPFEDEFELELPIVSKVLSYENQGGSPVMWALVNPEANKVIFRFRLIGTGHPIESRVGEDLEFIGTEQFGPLVFHLFQIVEG